MLGSWKARIALTGGLSGLIALVVLLSIGVLFSESPASSPAGESTSVTQEPMATSAPLEPTATPTQEAPPSVPPTEDVTSVTGIQDSMPTDIVTPTVPSTLGKVIPIADKQIQLPPDGYVEDLIMTVECVEGIPCPPHPYYIIVRGDSTVYVTLKGEIIGQEIVTGEEGAFDFLKEALGIDPGMPIGPPTDPRLTTIPVPKRGDSSSPKGGSIYIAGRSIQLPPDAYIQTVIEEVMCAVNGYCPPVPILVIAPCNYEDRRREKNWRDNWRDNCPWRRRCIRLP